MKRFSERLHELRATQQGFTLLELLVGIVIVSILMATAAQYFFQHRRKGWEAQVRASIRHMAGAQNYFVFAEGAPAFTHDLDDLFLVGYRWNNSSVRPYVALATNQTYCVQVHSAHDSSIVWHFSSNVGYPQEGPATPEDCGDPEVLGTYIAGLPPATAGRDGVPSEVAARTSLADNGSSTSEDLDGDGFPDGPGTGSGGGTSGPGGSGTDPLTSDPDDETTTTGSVPGYGTTDPTSGTVPGSGSTGSDPSGSGSGTGTSCDGGSSGSSGSGSNHPSGKDRDTENGGSGDQGDSGSDPDGDENGGADKPGEGGGANGGDQDGNNGSGNDTDFEDDNRGPDQDGSGTPGSGCS